MKNKITQKERIVKQLLKEGFITRNSCLRNFISRLSAYILELKEEGWEFETKEINNDYIYKIIKCPYKKQILTLANGEQIERFVI